MCVGVTDSDFAYVKQDVFMFFAYLIQDVQKKVQTKSLILGHQGPLEQPDTEITSIKIQRSGDVERCHGARFHQSLTNMLSSA